VLNWSISRNYKKISNSTKISVTPGMYLTRGGSVQKPLSSGPRGWPTGQVLGRFGPRLRAHVSTCEGEHQGSGESRWRLNHMASRPPLGELPTWSYNSGHCLCSRCPRSYGLFVVPTWVTILLGLRYPPRSWTDTVGPSLPGFTITPCVDSLLCYRSIRRPKSILPDGPEV
jgi:hypothetical protein